MLMSAAFCFAELPGKTDYGKLKISPADKTVTVSGSKITISPRREDLVYTISGYFEGQIVCLTKNTVIKLDNAYIENKEGEPAVLCQAKTELSTARGSVNCIASSGAGKDKTAALYGKKNLVLGGSGTLYVSGGVHHGIKADDVKMKGSGVFYISGQSSGSALNCNSFTVEKEKTFRAYFSDSQNGIKADANISISSGTFYFVNNKTAMKTDTKAKDPENPHYIRLYGGTIYNQDNGRLHETEEDGFKNHGAIVKE